MCENQSLRRIASQFQTSDATLRRHRPHIATAVQEVQAQAQAQETEQRTWNVLDRMQFLNDESHKVFEEAKAEGDLINSLKALGEIRQQVKLFSELMKGFEPGQAEKLEEEWLAVRETIFDALEPYPEARLSVARALSALGRNDPSHTA